MNEEEKIPEKAMNIVESVKAETNPKDAGREPITEESGIYKEWYKEARGIKTKEELCTFIDKLDTKYRHDYGTICHAIAAVAIAAAWVMERTDQGGITGFQAGAVNWEFISHWLHINGPARLLKYEHMLYPQYQNHFEKIIDQLTADWLIEEAKKYLKSQHILEVHPDVKSHWEMIAAGQLPWGYIINSGVL